MERVLMRLVVCEDGESLDKAEDPEQLISVANDCLQGIYGLWLTGILHRDISFGNLLTTIVGGALRGLVIDLGLAIDFTETELGVPVEGGELHHHLTGTLPFISVDLFPIYQLFKKYMDNGFPDAPVDLTQGTIYVRQMLEASIDSHAAQGSPSKRSRSEK
ncbi:hypothetical protein FRB93_010438 [Tulasnella sp. JGI-2019a]|nr:hypothetical protein FRB93_010438 [Tulasnella sp. JGI-2019a]